MKCIKIFIPLFFFVSHVGFAHDLRLAIFEISKSPSGLNMSVSIDREDILRSLKEEYPNRFLHDEISELAREYLVGNVGLEVNGSCLLLEFTGIEYGKDNIFLTGSIKIPPTNIEEVKLTNTCLVNTVDGHENIMKLKLNGAVRSFRLNKNRTSTIASYKKL